MCIFCRGVGSVPIGSRRNKRALVPLCLLAGQHAPAWSFAHVLAIAEIANDSLLDAFFITAKRAR